MAGHKHNNTSALVFALVVAWLATPSALAQQSEGQAGFQAKVGLYFDRNDNIYNSLPPEIESWIARLSPDLLLSSAPGRRQFSVQYVGNYGKFLDASESDDDYADHTVTGRGLFQTGSRGELEISAIYAQGHEGRGSGLTRGLSPDSPDFPSEPDEFDRSGWTVQYTHGAEGAKGQLDFGLGGNALNLDNNRERTQYFDRNEDFAFVGLTIGDRQRAAFVIQARYSDTNYDVDRPDEPSLNGDSWRGLLGFTWEATSKTKGSIRFGAQRRSFDDPDREATTNASWEVAIRWSPRAYSHVDFITTRENQETIRDGNFIDQTSYGISWTHEWSIGVESILRWDRQNDEFVGTTREEDDSEVYFGIRLPQGERVVWEAGASRRSRDSTIADLEYEGMLYTIGVNWQLTQ